MWNNRSFTTRRFNEASCKNAFFNNSSAFKCFNTVPNSLMVNPNVGGSKPTMMICGNDKEAKAKVEGILVEFGWDDVVDIGGIDGARYLESLVALWVRVGAARGTFKHAFKDLRD